MKKLYATLLTACITTFGFSTLCAQAISNWSLVGPIDIPVDQIGQINGIGRAVQIKFDPVNHSRIYAVSAHNIFVSNDTAKHWTVLPGADVMPSNGCASVCIDYTDNNILYLGTGDPNYYGSGTGVWKSIDGGQTFVHKNNGMGNVLVIDILMSPTDHNVLVAVTNSGIFKTTDGGNSWVKNTSIGNTAFTDTRMNTASNSTTIYAVTKTGGQFYKSTDMGSTWTNTFTETTYLDTIGTNGQAGRIATTEADPNVVYLSFIGSGTGGSTTQVPGGIVYRSDDGGNTFTLKKGNVTPNLTGYTSTTGGQGNYNFDMVVSPDNANTVYVDSHVIWRSTDGGVNWTQLEPSWAYIIHTDMHNMRFDPYDHTKLFNLNDGGVWLSTNGGTAWTPMCNGFATSEFYHFANSPADKNLIGGGLQDNAEVYFKTDNWYCNRGGDFTSNYYIDFGSTNTVYYVGNGNRRNLVTHPTAAAQTYNLPTTASNSDLYGFSPQDPNLGFYCQLSLWRTNNLQATNPTWTKLYTSPNTQLSLSVSPVDANNIYILYKNKTIVHSGNALSSTPAFDTIPYPSDFAGVSTLSTGSIVVLKTGVLYVAFNSRVFRSPDNGATWTAYSTSLPSVNIKKMIADTSSADESIYVVNTSVYHRTITDSYWNIFATNLPSSSDPSDMDIFYPASDPSKPYLRLSTYGRGLWETPLNIPDVATPLQLLNFSVLSQQNKNMLIWQTGSEINTKDFEIERKINNGSFQTIATQAAIGNNYTTTNYSYLDNSAFDGETVYYRLKMVDNDGQYTYSKIVSVKMNGQTNVSIKVAPNPVSGSSLHLLINIPSAQKGQIQLFDMSGKLLKQQTISTVAGTQSFDVNVENLASGTYVVRIPLDNGLVLTSKFIKQ